MTDRIATAVTYTASGSAIAFGMNANEIGAIIGATVAILSLGINIYYKHQHLQLARSKRIDDRLRQIEDDGCGNG